MSAETEKTALDKKIKDFLEGREVKLQEIKEATREANQVLKDLKAERKVCEAWILEQQDAINNQIMKHIRRELERIGPAIEKAVRDARSRINRQFDELAAILMGEDKKQREKPLKDVVREWMEKNKP